MGYQKRAQWDLGSARVVLLGEEVAFASGVDDDDDEEEEDSLTAFSRAEAL